MGLCRVNPKPDSRSSRRVLAVDLGVGVVGVTAAAAVVVAESGREEVVGVVIRRTGLERTPGVGLLVRAWRSAVDASARRGHAILGNRRAIFAFDWSATGNSRFASHDL